MNRSSYWYVEIYVEYNGDKVVKNLTAVNVQLKWKPNARYNNKNYLNSYIHGEYAYICNSSVSCDLYESDITKS